MGKNSGHTRNVAGGGFQRLPFSGEPQSIRQQIARYLWDEGKIAHESNGRGRPRTDILTANVGGYDVTINMWRNREFSQWQISQSGKVVVEGWNLDPANNKVPQELYRLLYKENK